MNKGKRVLLMAGWVPLPWFLFWTSVAGYTAPHYSAVSQHASELTLIPGLPHTLLDVAAIGSGLAFIAFAIGLWLESGRPLAFGAVSWLLFGVAMVAGQSELIDENRRCVSPRRACGSLPVMLSQR